MQKLMKDSAISKRYASSKENPLRKLSMEELPHKESMGIRFRKDKKQLNLRAAPFNRWLEKQIGRPWDKVHHEVCEASSANPELGLRGQLDWAVEQHVSEIGPDGTAYTGCTSTPRPSFSVASPTRATTANPIATLTSG